MDLQLLAKSWHVRNTWYKRVTVIVTTIHITLLNHFQSLNKQIHQRLNYVPCARQDARCGGYKGIKHCSCLLELKIQERKPPKQWIKVKGHKYSNRGDTKCCVSTEERARCQPGGGRGTKAALLTTSERRGHLKSVWITRRSNAERGNCIKKSMQVGDYLAYVTWNLHLAMGSHWKYLSWAVTWSDPGFRKKASHLEQCFAHSRCSVSVWWMTRWMEEWKNEWETLRKLCLLV